MKAMLDGTRRCLPFGFELRSMRRASAAGVCLAVACLTAEADAQLAAQTAEERYEEQQSFERRRQAWTLGGHNLVAPISLPAVPFEFAMPMDQLGSRTHIAYSVIAGDRNVDQGPTDVKYAQLAQAYDLTFRIAGHAEFGASLLGEAASGVTGESFSAGGAAVAAGGRISAAYRLVTFEKIGVTLRASGSYMTGYRANIEPLLYQIEVNAVSVLSSSDIGSFLGTPTRELDVSLGLALAYALTPAISFQSSLRLDRIGTKATPWLDARGTEAAGPREIAYSGWAPSFGIAAGMYVGRWLIQPQLGIVRRTEQLTSPQQDSGPYIHATYVAPAAAAMYLASGVLQLGGALGFEYVLTDVEDNYNNRFSTHTSSFFGQLVSRYVWSGF